MKIKSKTFALLCGLRPLVCSSIQPNLTSRQLIEDYVEFLSKIESKEGAKQAIAYAKECWVISLAIATNGKWEPIKFRKSNREGVPAGIKHLLPLLRGSESDKRWALTVISTYKAYRLPPNMDVSSITDDGPCLESVFDTKGFKTFCSHWLSSISTPKFSPSATWHNPGSKRGPNGPALLTAHWDAVALVGNEAVFEAIQRMAKFTRQSHALDLIYRMTANDSDFRPKLGRLAFLPEPGGKTRVIAIGDYYSQQVLKPLHDWIMEILRSLETDGTWNQDEQANRVKREAHHPCFSFDLSSATDRFPRALTLALLQNLIGEEEARDWETLMTSRDFQIGQKGVRYKVGQPMGLYTSWAAFALTHHALIQYLANLKGFKSFKNYSVLGDDVVIWNDQVALLYRETMEKIGVKINLTKSLVSEENHVRIEFAKRIFYNGMEYSPLNLRLLDLASKSVYNLPILFQELKRRGWKFPVSGEWDLSPGITNQKGLTILFLLSKCPQFSETLSGIPEEKASAPVLQSLVERVTAVSLPEVLKCYHLKRCKALEKRAEALQEDLSCLSLHLKKFLPKEGHFSRNILYSLSTSRPSHPAPFVIREFEEKVHKIQSDLYNLSATEVDLSESLLSLWEYVPTPIEETFDRDLRIRKSRYLAQTWLSALSAGEVKENTTNAPARDGGQSILTDEDYSDAYL